MARQPVEALAAAVRARGLAATIQDGGVLVTLDARAGAPALLRALLADGVDVYECRPLQPSLEELFLDAVGESTS